MNQTRTRLQSLGLLGRALRAASDDELAAMVAALDDDHREALAEIGGTEPAEIREAISTGRLDGTMESVAVVLTDTCLADCIEQLGDNADQPSTEQLQAVLPGLIERHGLAATRVMLASTVAGEANAAAIIRDLLRNDDVVKLPPAEEPPVVVHDRARSGDDQERKALIERRKEQRKAKQAEARARRKQSAAARRSSSSERSGH